MGTIRVMPAALANQIAAGEVVERPSSCVKELVENSLDAGAKHITVAIEEGGIASMVVQDDGIGMDEEDAVLAFARHATSKITQPRDLFAISTLGFRGEALASIAAVARVSLQSRRHTTESGVQVYVEGTDRVEPPVPIGMPPGTRIEVRDLFFNTPARLKYLRSVQTEQARVVEVVQTLALGRPDVAFRCVVNNHAVFQTSGRGDLLEVLAVLYGIGEAKQFLPVSAETPDYRIVGYVGRPTQSRATRAHAHWFVNQRPIRNIALHQAVIGGYKGRLMINRHPMYALTVVMDPQLVDVNIHPHKAEVRFSEERDVAALVGRAVGEALDGVLLTPDVGAQGSSSSQGEKTASASWGAGGFAPSTSSRGMQASTSFPTVRPQAVNRQVVQTALQFGRPTSENLTSRLAKEESAVAYHTEAPNEGVASDATAPRNEQLPPSSAGLEDVSSSGASTSSALVSDTSTADIQQVSADIHEAVEERPTNWRLRLVGQALGMYMVADDGESLYIIDQHAAHERVLYEQFSKQMQAREVRRLPLLTPLTFNLSPSQQVALSFIQDELIALGLEVEPFGPSDVIIRTIPDVWEGLDATALLEALLTSVESFQSVQDVRTVLREWVVLRACKAAIKANHRLSLLEMEALCESLSDLDDPFHCPHGRPVFLRMTNQDLEKGFRRIVS